jgi:hypothetical protein
VSSAIEAMTTTTELMKSCRDSAGIRGRFFLLAAGFVGFFFPGYVAYVVLKGTAKAMDDADFKDLLTLLESDVLT